VGPWGWIGWWLFDTDGWSSAYFIGDHGVFDGDEWWRKKNIGEAWGGRRPTHGRCGGRTTTGIGEVQGEGSCRRWCDAEDGGDRQQMEVRVRREKR
jgi:hypothetical protein